jgi:MFS family permease
MGSIRFLSVTGMFAVLSMVTGFFLPVYLRDDLGFTGVQIGFLFAMQAVTVMLASAPAGMGNDRVSSRFFIVLGLAGQAFGLVLMATVESFVPYVLVFFVWTLANGLFRVSLDVQALKVTSGDERLAGVYRYQLSRYAGATLGAVGAGTLLSLVDFRVALVAAAVAMTALSVVAVRLPPTRVAPVRFANYRDDLRNPRVILLVVWLVLFSTHWGAEFTSYGLFLQQDLHLSWTGMGGYIAAEHLAVVLMLAWFLRDPKRELNIKRLAFWGLLASGVGHVGMVFHPLWLSVLFRMMHGVGDGAIFLVFFLGVPKLFAVERLGGHAGLVHLMSMLGMVLGSLIYGPLGEAVGYAVPLWSSGMISCVLAGVMVVAGLQGNRRATGRPGEIPPGVVG